MRGITPQGFFRILQVSRFRRPEGSRSRRGVTPQEQPPDIVSFRGTASSWTETGEIDAFSRFSHYYSMHRRWRSTAERVALLLLLCTGHGKAFAFLSSSSSSNRSETADPGGEESGDGTGRAGGIEREPARLQGVDRARGIVSEPAGLQEVDHLAFGAKVATGDAGTKPYEQQRAQQSGPPPTRLQLLLPPALSIPNLISFHKAVEHANKVPGLPVTSPSSQPGVKGAPRTEGAGAVKRPQAGLQSLFTPAFMDAMNRLGADYPRTAEEEDEEALADAIIHGTRKAKVPRIRTAADTLVEAIEDEKLRQIAKTPRQLEVLRLRRAADAESQKNQITLPKYFTELAKEAAAYHKKRQQILQERRAAHPPGSMVKHLRTAQRRQQKDKLLFWKENQIYQVPDEGPDIGRRMDEALQTDKELAVTLDQDLPEEDLKWILGEIDREDESNGRNEERQAEGDKLEQLNGT